MTRRPRPRGARIIDAEDQVAADTEPAAGGRRHGAGPARRLQRAPEPADGRPDRRLRAPAGRGVPSGEDVREGPLRVTFRLRPERPLVRRPSGHERRRGVHLADHDGPGQPGGQPRRLGPDRRDPAGPHRDGRVVPAGHLLHGRLPRRLRALAGRLQRLGRLLRAPASTSCSGKDFNTVWNRGGIVGSGPFTLESFTPGVRAVLARDPGYWGSDLAGGGPFLDRLVVDFLDSPGAAITALRQGEAQMTSPPPDPALIARAAAASTASRSSRCRRSSSST